MNRVGLLGLTSGAGQFLGVKEGGLVVSSDGADWEYRSLSGSRTFEPTSIAYGQGWFVVAGNNGGIATSIDGLHWTTRTNLGTNWLREVAFLGDRFVATGDNGTIIESGPIAAMPPQWAVVPEGVTVGNDAPIQLCGWTASSEAVQYQWFKDGQPIPGANRTPLSLEHPNSAMSGSYRLVASNALGVASSSDVQVTILDPAPADLWQVVRYPGTSLFIDRLAHGAGGFVATTTNGTLAWSTNGTHCTPIRLPNERRFLQVRFVSTKFFALGEAGTVYLSTDGREWSAVSVPANDDLHDIAVLDGTWVIVGKRGTILISSDATSWSRVRSPTEADLHGVCGSDLGLMAVGTGGTLLLSYGGDIWFEDDSLTTADLWGMASNGDTALACGDDGTLVSFSGWNWQLNSAAAGPGRGYREVAVVDNTYRVVGPGWLASVKLSETGQGGLTTTMSSGKAFSRSFYSGLAPSTNGFFAAAGTAVFSITTSSGWRPLGGSINENLNAIADVACLLVVVGDSGTIVSSPDGGAWSLESSPTTNHLVAIAAGPAGGVMVGARGTILFSEGGHDWRVAEPISTNSLVDVCYGNGLFAVADDRGTVLASGDGRNWQGRVVEAGRRFYALRYFNSQYWALGSSQLFRSSDAVSRSSNPITVSLQPTDLAEDRGTILVLDAAVIRSTTDGETWSPRIKPAGASIQRIAVLGNIVVGAGGSESVWLTANQVDWYPRSSMQPFPIRGIRSLRGSVYAVGEYGVILRSAPNARLEVSRDEKPTLRLRDADGRSYRVEYSDSIGVSSRWQSPIGARLTPENPAWSDASATERQSRYYRAVLE